MLCCLYLVTTFSVQNNLVVATETRIKYRHHCTQSTTRVCVLYIRYLTDILVLLQKFNCNVRFNQNHEIMFYAKGRLLSDMSVP